MMHKLKKFKISYLWIPYLLLLPYTMVSKIIFYIFLMLTIHELAHITCAFLFHYPIKRVIIYPFGLAAQISYIGFGKLWEELCIILAGPAMHLLFPFLFQALVQMNWISTSFQDYLLMMNTSILIFNLLPIYPLDGGRVLQTLIHCCFRYKLAQRMTLIISFLCIIIVFKYQIINGISGIVVGFFLVLQIGMTWKEMTLSQMQFFHYRKQHPVTYPIIMNERQDLYRFRKNIMRLHKGWCEEATWLELRLQQRNKKIVGKNEKSRR